MSILSNISKDLLLFKAIELQEVNNKASLTSRVDKKYVLQPEQLPLLLNQLKNTHSVLEIDKLRIGNYQSIYFDTEDFSLFHAHHAQRENRVKFRIRNYIQSKISFFEIKTRSNYGLTEKQRFPIDSTNEIAGLLNNCEQNYPRYLNSKPLEESLQINYQRITLVSKTGVERVTIDGNLFFQNKNNSISFNDRIILEIKTEKGAHSPTERVLKTMGVREGSLSKYCLGILSLNKNVKFNLFKPTLHFIKKQLNNHESITGYC